MKNLWVNVGGTWRQINNGYVNQAGTWTPIESMYYNDAGTWKLFYERAFVVTINITANVNNFDLCSYLTANGWDGTTFVKATINVSSGVTVGSTNGYTPAMTIGTCLPASSTVTINNNGLIQGAPAPSPTWSASFSTGVGLLVSTTNATVVINNNSLMGGGGGATQCWGLGHNGGVAIQVNTASTTTLNNLGIVAGGGGGTSSGDSGGSYVYSNYFWYPKTCGTSGGLGYEGGVGAPGLLVAGAPVWNSSSLNGLTVTNYGQHWRGGNGSTSGAAFSAGYGVPAPGYLSLNYGVAANGGQPGCSAAGRGQTGTSAPCQGLYSSYWKTTYRVW